MNTFRYLKGLGNITYTHSKKALFTKYILTSPSKQSTGANDKTNYGWVLHADSLLSQGHLDMTKPLLM